MISATALRRYVRSRLDRKHTLIAQRTLDPRRPRDVGMVVTRANERRGPWAAHIMRGIRQLQLTLGTRSPGTPSLSACRLSVASYCQLSANIFRTSVHPGVYQPTTRLWVNVDLGKAKRGRLWAGGIRVAPIKTTSDFQGVRVIQLKLESKTTGHPPFLPWGRADEPIRFSTTITFPQSKTSADHLHPPHQTKWSTLVRRLSPVNFSGDC